LIHSKVEKDKWLFVLEDLDAAGYPRRSRDLDLDLDTQDIHACLAWLASFHARFLGTKPNGLWKTGTYWHLATRSDELAAMHHDDDDLREAAPILDKRLREATFQTLVHGDAKPANFCFARRSGAPVAAVDFAE
jgi:aminoglycoside phosphotransferase (APT) family kinase protein